jgi:hypothetical protein
MKIKHRPGEFIQTLTLDLPRFLVTLLLAVVPRCLAHGAANAGLTARQIPGVTMVCNDINHAADVREERQQSLTHKLWRMRFAAQ